MASGSQKCWVHDFREADKASKHPHIAMPSIAFAGQITTDPKISAQFTDPSEQGINWEITGNALVSLIQNLPNPTAQIVLKEIF